MIEHVIKLTRNYLKRYICFKNDEFSMIYFMFLIFGRSAAWGFSLYILFGTEIYDIATEILYFQCFVTTDMFLFCKPINFSGNCRILRDLAFGSVKTRFKAILKKLDFSAQIDFFMNFCPRRATKLRSL